MKKNLENYRGGLLFFYWKIIWKSLRKKHRYEIVFTLPEVPGLGKNVCPAPVPSPHLRITNILPAPEGGLKVACEYMALQEGVLCEEVLLLSETNDDICVRVKVHARVMGEVVLSRHADNDLDVLC
uniref:Adipose secreted signaling protein n=1 Tax=Oryzias sinensis TaxID=183150 RepID=A0A8C7WXU4_9TELE